MSEYNVGDYYHRPGDRISFEPFPSDYRPRRRDRRMFEDYNRAVRQPDGTIVLHRAPWWVRVGRKVRRWVRL